MKIITKKKPKRQMNAKENFFFDFDYEYAIYSFLCDGKIKRKYKKKISGFEFERYVDWKNYIVSKYQGYGSEGLLEFSRYLNQRTREKKALLPIAIMYFTPVLSCFITFFINYMTNLININTNPFGSIIIFMVFITIFTLMAYKSYLKEELIVGFYEDYKQIIDEIIEKEE